MKKKAIECYNKALELDPARTNAREKLAELKKQGDE
ncbi:MAG: tetratricopeptide repeat protein [Candidatus Aminicenantes bacterium]|nr:tetratricopeptide repeat protein [Candidatus Aminicenantes bacterium]